ncbi:MAG: hypothetical protein ACI8W8_003195 [Rhodothermales bacterium]|jgi:uncharacterized protein (TIGR02231 family)
MTNSVTETIELHAPVVRVTLLEDRAKVVRRGVLTASGHVTLRIPEVAPILHDRSLSARALDSEQTTVLDIRVDRWPRRRILEQSPEQAALTAEQQQLDTRRIEANDQIAGLQTAIKSVAAIRARTLADIAEDGGWNLDHAEQWQQALDRLHQHERELRRKQLDLLNLRENLLEDQSKLQARMSAANAGDDDLGAAVLIDFSSQCEQQVTLEVHYTVPNACWRPCHRAQLGGDTVRWAGLGCVWQGTGEAWEDIELLLSTQRTREPTEPPLLTSDSLAVQPKHPDVEVSAWDQEIQHASLGSETSDVALPGVDDGGHTVALRSTHKVSVASDGRPSLVPLFEFEAKAEREHVLTPELAAAVILKTTIANAAAVPLLAGPVELIRHSGTVGRTSIEYAAPGERVSFGWGPLPEVTVYRSVQHEREKDKLLSSWHSDVYRVDLTVNNLDDSPCSFIIRERIPISEIDKVEVRFDAAKTSGDVAPDENGFVTWQIELAPHSYREIRLAFNVRLHSSVHFTL